MTLPPALGDLLEVRGALTADRRGQLQDSVKVLPSAAEEAAAVAASVTELEAAGAALGLGGLGRVEVRGSRRTTLTAVRPDQLLLVDVDPGQRLARAGDVVDAWLRGESLATPRPTPPRSGLTGELPAAEQPPARPAVAAEPSDGRLDGPGDPWGALRRALIRGQLTRAATFQQAMLAAGHDPAPTPGSEPLPAEGLQASMQRLLEGIGSVMAGDPMGGARSLSALAVEGQPNLSIRWLAHYWSARAAMQGGGAETAREHVRDTLALSRQLDVEARGISQLLASELLARGGDLPKALSWLAEARGRFERVADTWGLGQSWLAEARILASRDEASSLAAAQRAREVDPAWDEPPVFLASRAVMAGDPAGALAALGELRSPATDRIRALLEAVTLQRISLPDAGEYLRIQQAPPSGQNLRSLERIANGSPMFFQAREALAWHMVRLGNYDAAREIFEWLLKQPLGPSERALVSLGLNSTSMARPPAGTAGATPPPLPGSISSPPGARGTSSNPDAMFSGRLSVFSLADLVEFLRTAGRSGLLVCSSLEGMGAFRFRRGKITGAATPTTPDLGELLVRSGRLTAEALSSARPTGDATPIDAGLADRLVQLGVVDVATVREAGRQQIERALRVLIDWRDGEFAFTREEDVATGEASVEVDAQQLLLDLFRERDESSRDPSPGSGS